MRSLVVVLALGAYVACAELSAPFTVGLRKTEDSAVATSSPETGVITITCPSGIGGAKLTRTGARWPARIIIRLKLRNLESFEMGNGILHFATSLKGPHPAPYWKMGGGKDMRNPPDGTLEVAISQTAGEIEIVVPREMMAGNPQDMDVTWINEYR